MTRVKFLKTFGEPQAPPGRGTGGGVKINFYFIFIAASSGAPPAPQFFFSLLILSPPTKAVVSQIGTRGAPKVAPKAPLPRRMREITPKVGVSRVIT